MQISIDHERSREGRGFSRAACVSHRNGGFSPLCSRPGDSASPIPQGLKPAKYRAYFGTTEVVPFPKLFPGSKQASKANQFTMDGVNHD
jgi:hypothetical protein